jgi:transcriptional regulator with XRE-family HTH domain
VARLRHGHSQEECASALMVLGLPTATQAQVCRWETGATKIPRLATRIVLDEYVASAPEAPIADEPPAPAEAQQPYSDYEVLAEAGRQITQEPFFGEWQLEYIRSQIERLARIDKPNKYDDAARRDLMATLGLLPATRPGQGGTE